MDPVTHGVVGVAAALGICRRFPEAEASCSTRLAAALCALLAAEAPDADRWVDACLKPYGDEGQGLAYMLYHRGPTHTVLASLAIALLIGGLASAVLRRASTFRLLFTVAFAGVALHLGMDAMNDYGVHPFPPISQRWFYGDFLFLAEPTISATLLPCVLALAGVPGSRLVPICLAIGIVAVSALLVTGQWLTQFGAIATVVWLAIQAFAQRSRPRVTLAWLSLLGVLTIFFVASRVTRARAVAWAEARDLPVTDVATTPAPGNPLCWRFITLTRKADAFEEHLGVVSLWSRLTHAPGCFSPPYQPGARPKSVCLSDPTGPDSGPEITEIAAFRGDFRLFEKLAQRNQRAAATAHFLRMPFWGYDARGVACPSGSPLQPLDAAPDKAKLLIGDLRVDYDERDLGEFCKYAFEANESKHCNRQLPLMASPPLLPLLSPKNR
ncbi:MAG: metal-dependent hydrolase [Polyangiaceae bacterium]